MNIRETAQWIVNQVQGTMALEGQGLSEEDLADMLERTVKDLLMTQCIKRIVKDDPLKLAERTHGFHDNKTLCGKTLDSRWYVVEDQPITCKKCLTDSVIG